MSDPSSFGTALWILLIITALLITFGLAALSDMAMRRREDRAAQNDPAQWAERAERAAETALSAGATARTTWSTTRSTEDPGLPSSAANGRPTSNERPATNGRAASNGRAPNR